MTGASGVSMTGPLPKWQLALAVAAPVALGLGYMYYKNNSKPSSEPSRGKSKNNFKKNGAPSTEKQISIDVDCLPKSTAEPETPLEKAQKLKAEGNELFKIGKYDEAISHYNNAIKICPIENTEALATFYQNRAAAYEQLKKYSSVKADCTKALELNPRYAKALLRRARAMEHCNELKSAFEDFTAACFLENFTNQTAIMMADKVLKQLGRQHAAEYLANKKLVVPSKHYIKTYINTFYNDPVFSLHQNPDYGNISPGFAKVLQCMQEQQYDDVIPYCTEELNSSNPDTVSHKMEILLLRATFYLLLGQHDAAIEDFEVIINTDDVPVPLKVYALIKRATLFMQLENPDKSFCDFKMAAELDPECGDVYHHRGHAHLLMEKIHEAREDFKKATELNPNFGLVYVQKCYTDYRYGMVERSTEIIEKAMKDFEVAFEKFPDCPECYTMYAQTLMELQEYQKADAYFAKAIEKDPNNATVYVHRGLLHLQWNANINKAVEYINTALKIDDKCEYGYETLGTIEAQRGNIEEAIKLFDKALTLSRTLIELTHIFSLKDAAKTRLTIKEKLNSDIMLNFRNI
ncbi:Mitochondrial import receptor subunit TOM70 [Eufriesea mexicana]|uniref:mitochondrial import receptor subunit TOM70 n=1 Tax=Eufriesea mexicana TaxID=516756 RepID=UPI00083BB6D0|nr:PREDICTED: mitochondrial import receptor subunit TOM70 [Eufriesea mexicana]OAD61432.1 Mitochondrial import receptor subunit TOM70 [Eufriesea mexicana]